MFFAGEELEYYIKDFIKKLEAGNFDDKLVYTKRLSKAPSEYTKNIPIHVRAALKIEHNGPYRLKEVSYVITKNGPEPINNNPTGFDYQHYIEKQLKPIADDILISQDKSFDSFIVGDQLSFF
jgi:DNA polymerase-2